MRVNSSLLPLLLCGCAVVAAAAIPAPTLAGDPAGAPPDDAAAKPAGGGTPAELPCDGGAAAAASRPEPPQRVLDGIAAYDAGLYPEALTLFEAADAAGEADGLVLYRMAYCYGAARRDVNKARQTYERALAALDGRVRSGAATLEERFYLVNVLLNLSRVDEARAAAQSSVAAIEACEVEVGPGGRDAFRVGKIYGDAGRTDRQAAWYRRALARFDEEPDPPEAYVERAARGVASHSLEMGRWAEAVPQLETLHGKYPRNREVLTQLIVAYARSGNAKAAHGAIDRMRPIAGQRVSDLIYLKGLVKKTARMLESGHPLPDREPDGTAYAALSADELKLRIGEATEAGKQMIGAPPEEGSYVVEERLKAGVRVLLPGPELLARIDELQGRFAALAYESVRRGLSLRETAFSLGAAPLFVHDWRARWIHVHRTKLTPEERQENPASG